MAAQDQTALRKRQQIAGANRIMFFWVAGASVIVGAAIVVGIMLVQKLTFNEKVLSEKGKTNSTLEDNLSTVGKLKDEIRVMNTNSALKSVMTPDEQEPIQVVLDALPSEANSAALGSSLQNAFLNDPRLKIQSITVDPVQGVEQLGDSSSATDTTTSSDGSSQPQISFHFVVGASDMNVLKELLQKLERSIRTLDVTKAQITVQDQGDTPYQLTVDGVAFYQLPQSVNLNSKTIKP